MSRFLAVFVFGLLSLCCTACGRRDHQPAFDREKDISAVTFSSDPLTCRLALAVEKGDRQEIEAAIAAGADVNAFGKDGFRLLDWAMARDNPVGFGHLLACGASLDALYMDPRGIPDRSFNTTLLERVLSTDADDFISAVLRTGLHPDHVVFPADGRSLLFFAAHARATHVVDALLNAGASIDHQDSSGRTALFESMLSRNYQMSQHLLDRGADPTVATTQGHDFIWGIKEFGSRGVRPGQEAYFEAVVAELVSRGLLTRQDIIEADRPKTSAGGRPAGITVIEHEPHSEAGRAIRELDRRERESQGR